MADSVSMSEASKNKRVAIDLAAGEVFSAMLADPSAESIHAARVLIKKLRARLRLLMDLHVPHDELARLEELLHGLGKLLARRRDIDVAQATLRELLAKGVNKKSRLVITELLEYFATDTSVADIDPTALTPQLAEIGTGLAQLGEPVLEYKRLLAYLQDALLDCCDCGDVALKDRQCKPLHQWRKDSKRIYFQLQTLPSAPRILKLLARLDKLGKRLGAVQDVCFIHELVRNLHEQGVLSQDIAPLEKVLDKQREKQVKKATSLQRKICQTGLVRIE